VQETYGDGNETAGAWFGFFDHVGFECARTTRRPAPGGTEPSSRYRSASPLLYPRTCAESVWFGKYSSRAHVRERPDFVGRSPCTRAHDRCSSSTLETFIRSRSSRTCRDTTPAVENTRTWLSESFSISSGARRKRKNKKRKRSPPAAPNKPERRHCDCEETGIRPRSFFSLIFLIPTSSTGDGKNF